MSTLTNRHQVRIVAIGTALYCASALIFTVMPAFLGAVAQTLHASTAALGSLSAVELGAIALASLSGPFWIDRIDLRKLAAVGASVSFVGQCATLFMTDYWTLVAARALTGAFGEGLLLALSYSLLGQTRNVERSFGIAYGVSILAGTASLYTSPRLDRLTGSAGVMITLAILALVALTLSIALPPRAVSNANALFEPVPAAKRPDWLGPGPLALIGQAIWYAGVGGFWSFSEQVASSNAVGLVETAQAMAIGTAAALAGTFITVWDGGRFGRTVPILVSTTLIIAAVAAFATTKTFLPMTVELALFNIFWASGTIYVTAATCSFDASGKVAVLLPAFQVIGMALGTLILGSVLGALGLDAIAWVIGALLIVGTGILLTCIAWDRKSLKRSGATELAAVISRPRSDIEATRTNVKEDLFD